MLSCPTAGFAPADSLRRLDPCKPGCAGLLAALACGSGSGLFVRRDLAVVKASERKRMNSNKEQRQRRELAEMAKGSLTLTSSGESERPRRASVPHLLLTREEAARALGMSLSHFQRHVQPYLGCVYCGQLRLYPPRELRRWIDRQVDGTGSPGVTDR